MISLFKDPEDMLSSVTTSRFLVDESTCLCVVFGGKYNPPFQDKRYESGSYLLFEIRVS